MISRKLKIVSIILFTLLTFFSVTACGTVETSGTGSQAVSAPPDDGAVVSGNVTDSAGQGQAEQTGQSAGTQTSENRQAVDTTPEASVDTPPGIRFIAVGDLMLGRGVGYRLKKEPGVYDYPFSAVSSILKTGDIVFANLEDPITASTHSLDPKRKIVLKALPDAIEALKAGGFNMLSIANNHMLDYYDTGLFDTIKVLDENGISYAGGGKNIEEARKPAIIEKNGLKIGFLCYTDMAQYIYAGNPMISFAAGEDKAGVAPRDYESIKEDISKLRPNVDILAVSLHWGVENTLTPTAEQTDFARKLIDDGADVILGHHPHRFQGIEIYKGKPILYSMGNFIFDQDDPINMESFIVDMKFEGNRLQSLTATPVKIAGKTHVIVQTGLEAKEILSREVGLCSKLGTDPKVQDDRLVFDLG